MPVVPRAVDAGAPTVFTLSTLLEDDRIAGTAVTLAALHLPVAGTTVSQATEVTIANGLAPSALEIVENDQRKTVRLAPQVDQVVITGSGVVVDLPATALTAAESLQLDRVDPAGAPGPLPGAAVSTLVAVTLTSGRTAFSGPVTLRLPYPDAEPDGIVDGTSPALAALALTVWHFDTARSTWERLGEARVLPAFHEVRVDITQTGLYGVFQAADGSTGLAGTTAPAPPAPLSAGAQGSGWQDIGVVTTFPFLVPLNTTTLPNGTYAVRAVCATQLADLATVQAAPTPTVAGGSTSGGGGGGGGGCSLRPGGGGTRTTALDALGNVGLPLVVLLVWACRSGGDAPLEAERQRDEHRSYAEEKDMTDQRRGRQNQRRAIGLALMGSLLLAGPSTFGTRTSGVSGPVEWRTTDFAWGAEGFGEQSYTFTLLLRETQGNDLTFTHVAAVLHNAADSRPAFWERTGQWRVPARGELPIPLGSRRDCPSAPCWDSGPGLVPVWHLTLTGTDQRGQPVRLVMDLRLPPIPNVVRSY